MKFLVVEDNRHARDILARYLWLMVPTAEVLVAKAAAGGIALIQLQKPDIILANLHVPVTDGYEFACMARQITAAPIICVTADVFSSTPEAVRAWGANGLITKPIDNEAIGFLVELQ